MQCALCASQAELHLTTVVQRQTQQLHLCRRCAEQHNLTETKSQEFLLGNALQMMLGQHTLPLDSNLVRLRCAECGLGYLEFRANGWLGCGYDYPLFQSGIVPLLQRLHQASVHMGKMPKRASSLGATVRTSEPLVNGSTSH